VGTFFRLEGDRVVVDGRMESSDSELLKAVADGDTAALAGLYQRHAPWLSVRLMRRCNDDSVVADVLQDTFVAVWRGAGSYRGEAEVAGWLWGVAVRRLVSRLRRRGTRIEVPFQEVRGLEASVEEQVLEGVEYGDLGSALARLSPEMRAVVQATVLDGLTAREAARLLGIPTNTVKTRLFRAKAQLRRELVEVPL
jgi:RNA polymerase sigma-70 factor, ECF subfamily